MKELHRERIAAGLCPDCGQTKGVRTQTCEECARKDRERMANPKVSAKKDVGLREIGRAVIRLLPLELRLWRASNTLLPPPNLRIIEKDGLGTLYNWRRRPWSVFVPSHEFQRHREQLMLQRANEKMGWEFLRRKFPQDWAQRYIDAAMQ